MSSVRLGLSNYELTVARFAATLQSCCQRSQFPVSPLLLCRVFKLLPSLDHHGHCFDKSVIYTCILPV